MKKLLILILAFVSIISFGQTEKKKEIKKEVKIENTEGKYKVTLITTENGETKTITRTYDSMEKMKNDPDMEDIKIMHLDDKGDNVMFFHGEPGDEDLTKEIKMMIKTGDGEDLHFDHNIEIDDKNTFIFKSDGEGSADMHKIKVWVDEDGKKHISKDGVEIDPEQNSWTSDDGKTYDIKKLDGKVMFMSEDEIGEFITEDGKHIEVKVDVNAEAGEDGEVEKEVIIITTGEGNEDAEKVVVKIVEEIRIHLEEVSEDDFNNMPGLDAKALKLDDLNYYPNPNSGKFTLAFQSDKKPTEIKITNVDGKEVYAERLQSFEGSYNKEIDLSGQKPGIYLLQIIQGKRAMNKKIVIE